MGGYWSNLMQNIYPSERKRIIFRGLDGGGKTTILYRLKGEPLEWTVPTLGFNAESIKLKNNITLQGWDLGGGWVNQKIFHHHYCEKVKVLVWVIDVIDFDRIQVVKQYFDESLVHEKLKDPIIVVLLNKIDLAESASKTQLIEQVKDKLDLNRLTEQKRTWNIFACSGLTGEGLEEAMDWVGKRLHEKRKRWFS